MRNFYFAMWAPGCTSIEIYDGGGGHAGSYCCSTVVRAVALGPRYFAFLTHNGVFCIDAETQMTWNPR